MIVQNRFQTIAISTPAWFNFCSFNGADIFALHRFFIDLSEAKSLCADFLAQQPLSRVVWYYPEERTHGWRSRSRWRRLQFASVANRCVGCCFGGNLCFRNQLHLHTRLFVAETSSDLPRDLSRLLTRPMPRVLPPNRCFNPHHAGILWGQLLLFTFYYIEKILRKLLLNYFTFYY